MGVAGGAAALRNTGNTGGATSARRSSQPCPGVAKHPDGSSGHGLATAEGCRNFLRSAVEDAFPSVGAEKISLAINYLDDQRAHGIELALSGG